MALAGQPGRVLGRASATGPTSSVRAASRRTLSARAAQSAPSAPARSATARCSLATQAEPSDLPSFGTAPRLTPAGSKWTRAEIQALYDSPLLELAFQAATVHRQYHDPSKVQLCTLLNIKTGGCSEDCSYCSQSSKNPTGLKATKLMDIEPVLAAAREAKANGSTRFCMGAAWRDLNGRKSGFKRIVEMVKEIRAMDLEVCTTLGMLDADQARQLKEMGGLSSYNHNIDTSREHYPKVITTRTFDERLQTIEHVRNAGLSVCSGGIIGLGEAPKDRVGLIWEMAQMPEAPESFPVNALVAIEGTPLENEQPVTFPEMLRTVATARIVLKTSIVRLAAGRTSFSEAEQAMCFMAGANSIFTGGRMLTTATNEADTDHALLDRWGLVGMRAFESRTMAPHAARGGSASASESLPMDAAAL